MFLGTIGFFLFLMFLFLRFLPMISIFEMRTLVPGGHGSATQSHEKHGGSTP
jgi:molybdopterin-containing oxidoreductase family membrane subunit